MRSVHTMATTAKHPDSALNTRLKACTTCEAGAVRYHAKSSQFSVKTCRTGGYIKRCCMGERGVGAFCVAFEDLPASVRGALHCKPHNVSSFPCRGLECYEIFHEFAFRWKKGSKLFHKNISTIRHFDIERNVGKARRPWCRRVYSRFVTQTLPPDKTVLSACSTMVDYPLLASITSVV